MNYVRKMPDNHHQAQQYALPRRHTITNEPPIQNEFQKAEKKELSSTNTIRSKPKASNPLIFNPPKVQDQQIRYKQISDYIESEEDVFNETENEINSSELETLFLNQLSEQTDKVTKEMEELKHSSIESKKEKGSFSDEIYKDEIMDYTRKDTILDESSSIEKVTIQNEDLENKFSAMLEESDTLPDESSSSQDKQSFSNDNTPNYEGKTSPNKDLVKEFTALLEESSSSTDETSSNYDEPSYSEESSFNFEESCKESSSYTDETSSSYEESSRSDESSFNFEESSKESSSIVGYLDKCKVPVQHPIVKLPILLALIKVDIDFYDSFNLEIPVSTVTKIDLSINTLHCKVLLPTSYVFLKGELIADIEYVKDSVENSLHSIKILIPIDKVIKTNWLHSPKLSSTHQAEYMFQSKDHNDIQFHREFTQQFAEPIYSELQGVQFIWHDELISNDSKRELDLQGYVNLSINLLQSQYVDLNTK